MAKKTWTEPETNKLIKLMTIFTKSGNVQLRGPGEELRRFKERLKDKNNRHTFLEVPAKLFAFNPALEEVTVLPADAGIIIIADPVIVMHNRSKIFQPVGMVPKKLS